MGQITTVLLVEFQTMSNGRRFQSIGVQRKRMLVVFTNSLSKKRSSEKRHLKVKRSGESLLLLFMFHGIDYLPI